MAPILGFAPIRKLRFGVTQLHSFRTVMSPTSELQDCSFTKFADAFLELHRRGVAPTMEQAIEEFPHLESLIRSRLPALVTLESSIGGAADPIANQPLDGCRFIEEIGRGSCGTVYRASQPALNREVAIKAIRVRPGQEKVLRRFGVECEAMAKLEHPNIVPVYGYSQVDSDAYLIMKLISGYSFDRLLKGDCDYRGTVHFHNVRSDFVEFALVARDIASALAHAHANGLVHRDVKPSNLMLDLNGKVWISDFGLAKMQDHSHSLSQTGDVIGTPRYMAPEQLRGTSDARSDVYSLGLTLYEIATGNSARNEAGEIGSPPALSGLQPSDCDFPSELIQVIEKAAAFSPEDRFQSAEEVAIVLDRFLQGLKPDRRKRKRQPDHVFRRNSRLRILGMFLSSAAAVTYFCLNPMTLSPPQPTATVDPEELTLIENLVGDPEHDVREYISQVAIKTVGDASEELGLNQEEAQELRAGVEDYVIQLRSGEVSVDTLDEIAQRFQDSPLSDASRVMACTHLVIRSGLSQPEQSKALEAIRKLAYAVASGQFSRSKSRSLTQSLAGKASSLRALKQTRVTDAKLRNWVATVEASVRDFDTSGVDLREELRQMLLRAEVPEQGASTNLEEIERQIEALPPELREMAREHLRARSTP